MASGSSSGAPPVRARSASSLRTITDFSLAQSLVLAPADMYFEHLPLVWSARACHALLRQRDTHELQLIKPFVPSSFCPRTPPLPSPNLRLNYPFNSLHLHPFSSLLCLHSHHPITFPPLFSNPPCCFSLPQAPTANLTSGVPRTAQLLEAFPARLPLNLSLLRPPNPPNNQPSPPPTLSASPPPSPP